MKHKMLVSYLVLSLGGIWSMASHALDISGSSTVQPIVTKLVPMFTAKGGEAVKLSGGGSGAGVKNTMAGASAIGMVSRSLSDKEKEALKFTTIGIDALAMLVHQSNPVSALTKAQVVDLYTGKTTNWKELGGPDLPVIRISKEVGRSTLELFEHYTGLLSPDRPQTDGKPLIHKTTYVIGANMEALMLVGGLPGAIGYASFGDAQILKTAGLPIQIVKLDNVVPSVEVVVNRSYPIVRELNLVYTTDAPPVADFLALALSDEGQAVVKSLGFVPVKSK